MVSYSRISASFDFVRADCYQFLSLTQALFPSFECLRANSIAVSQGLKQRSFPFNSVLRLGLSVFALLLSRKVLFL